MVNTAICKRCQGSKHLSFMVDRDGSEIACPKGLYPCKVEGLPPDDCPYYLEHALHPEGRLSMTVLDEEGNILREV